MILKKYLNKSFSKLAPNCTITNSRVASVVQTAAMTQDFLENTTKKMGNKPNADIIFKRIKECDVDKLKLAFMLILDCMVKNIKKKFNHRKYILAIDTHYEPFYGIYKDLWVHGYRPDDSCNGSYCYITIALVVGQQKFTLLALPVHSGENKAELIEELILVSKKYTRIKLVLLDRGFDSGRVIRKLKEMKIKFIIFAKKNKKIKRFFEETSSFSHKYFYDKIVWPENKTLQREPTKYLIIKDYIDVFRTWKIYDWAFIINLSNVKARSYVHIYMKRWCIENAYKQFNGFKIKTISVNFIVRYFFFLFRVLLYNLWKFYNTVMGVNTTFKEFVYILCLASLDVDHIRACKEKMDKFVNLISFIE